MFSNNFAQGSTTTMYYSSSYHGNYINSVADGGSTTTMYYSSSYHGNDTKSVADGGVIYAQASDVGIDGNATFTNNSATDNGGVIYANLSDIGIDGNASFTRNSAGSDGGVIYGNASDIGIDGTASFTSNSAGSSGGVIYADLSDISIDGNASFTRNSAGYGGAVLASQSTISLDGHTEFSSNNASIFGGAILTSQSRVSIDGNATFTSNSASESGAMEIDSSELSIDGNATFTSNTASTGGAVYLFSGSNISIGGYAMFTNNSASADGGAIFAGEGSFMTTNTNTLRGDLSGIEGGYYTSNWSVGFVNNSAGGLGGAIVFQKCDQIQISDVLFKSNQASLGGAVYILAEDDKETKFSDCVLEGNTAEDGGAVYLNTGPGVDIFTACVFRANFAETSGGAIFHTGSMRVFNTSFVANMAGVEGPGVISVGFLEKLSNVSFVDNTFQCRAGEYGYINKNEPNLTQGSLCLSCFDEVCSRCSSVRDGVNIREEVRVDGKPVCERPPLGATANSRGTTVANLTLEKGYFRTSNQSHVMMQCFRRNACQGGKDANEYCAPGYTGPYCAVCDKGFAPGISYSCRKCSGDVTRSAVGLAVAVVLVVLLSAGLLLSHLGRIVHDGANDGTEVDQRLWKNKCKYFRASLVNLLPVRAIKIVVTVWQIIYQFDAIAGDIYPDLYQTFVSKLNPINLDLDFVFSYSCLVSNDFYHHLVIATTMPLVALVVLAGSYFIGKRRNNRSESAMREVRHKHQAVVLFIAFFVYSPVSYRIFQTFGCDELDDGTTYLRADYSLSCSAPRHSWYKVYAFIMVAVYPIGIAAAFAGLLFMHRGDLVKPDRGTMLHLKPLNGIWAAYKPSRYYYEVIECGRRITSTVIAAFILPNSAAQISIALFFAVVYVYISEVLSPFQKGIDTVLYRWGNGIIVASMYVAFLAKIDVGQDTASAGYLLTYSGVLIAANIFMVVTVLIQTILLAKEMHAMNNAVRVSDIPVRRTHSVSLRDLRPVLEGEDCTDRFEALESKDCEI